MGLAGPLGEGELPALLVEIERLAPGLDDHAVGQALDALAPRIGGRYAPRLVALARSMRIGTLRASALVAVAPIVKQRDRQAMMEEALDTVLSDGAPLEQPVLAPLLATIPAERSERIREPLVRAALANIQHADDVVRLARGSLRGEEQMRAARRVIDLDPWKGGLKELLDLASEVPDAELGELLELARGVDPKKRDDRTLASLVSDVAPRLSTTAHAEALAIVDELGESLGRCVALAALGELNRAAAEAALLADPVDRAKALFGLGESTLDAAVRAAGEVGDPATRAELLLSAGRAALAPQALDLVPEVDEPWRRVALLLEAIALTDDREPLVRETLALIAERAAENFNPTPGGQLAALAPYLPASLAREAIDIALQIDEHQSPLSVGAMSDLAPHLRSAELHLLVERCGRLVPVKRARVLRDLAASAPEALHPAILDQAAQLDAADIRGVVTAYARRIAPSLLGQALQLCRPIGDMEAALTAATGVAVAARISPVPGVRLRRRDRGRCHRPHQEPDV